MSRHLALMIQVVQKLIDEGHAVTPEIRARRSLYKTEHMNRFGTYELRFEWVPQPITEALRCLPTRIASEL